MKHLVLELVPEENPKEPLYQSMPIKWEPIKWEPIKWEPIKRGQLSGSQLSGGQLKGYKERENINI
jgi:hypothetical protein